MEDDRIFRLNLHKFLTSAVTEYSVHMIFVKELLDKFLHTRYKTT